MLSKQACQMRNIKFLPVPVLPAISRRRLSLQKTLVVCMHTCALNIECFCHSRKKDVVSRCRLQILSFFHLRKEEPKTKQEYKLCHLLNHVTDPLWFHRSSLKLKNKDNFVEYLKFCDAKQQRTLPIQLLILLCIIMNDNSGKDNLPWDKVSAPLVHGWRVLAGSGAGLEGEREKGRRSVFPIKSRGRKL